MFRSTPLDPKMRGQYAVRNGNKLEVKRWRFENRVPLLQHVAGSCLHLFIVIMGMLKWMLSAIVSDSLF